MSKVMSMKDAISKTVKSGDLVFIGGMQHGEPSAAVHEILRQRIDHLTLTGALTVSTTLLIAEGRVDKVLTGYYAQDVNRSVMLSRAREAGKLPRFVEYSHFGIAQALLAGQMGIPYIPVRSMVGSDMLKYNDNIKLIDDPFNPGQKTGAVRAINPDVGIIHVQRCDKDGNAQRYGTIGVDAEGVNASKTVIVTTEKIVESDVIRRDPNRTIIPGYRVAAVVEAPFGAYPMHLAGCYLDDRPRWMGSLSSEDGLALYLELLVYGCQDWNEYMEKQKELNDNPRYFEHLKIKQIPSDPIYSGNEELGK